MAETIGSRLRATREAKGMSIEDVAFETRIHAPSIRSLEADDYSNFASTTYAKGFLSLYSRFLGVDAAEALHYFAGGDEVTHGHKPYLSALQPIESAIAPRKSELHSANQESRKTVSIHREKPGLAPILLGLILLVLLAGIPLLWFLGKDASSIDDVTTKARELAETTRNEIASPNGQLAEAVGNSSEEPALTAAEETPLPKANAAAASNTKAGGKREVAADWVLEETTRTKDPSSQIGGAEAESTLDDENSKRVDSGKAPPVVAIAIPTATEPTISQESQDPPKYGFTGARAVPMGETPTPSEDEPEPAKPEAPTQATPESTRSTVVVPLRAVPFVAQPVVIEEEDSAIDEGASDEEESDETSFVDPKHRFPRPLN